MDLTIRAPVVHARPKTRWNPSRVDMAITMALRACRGTPRAVPVLHDGRVLGLARSDWRGDVVSFTPITHRQWCGFNKYSDLDSAAKNGQMVVAYFFKDLSTGPAIGWSDAWPCQGSPGSGVYSGSATTLRGFTAADVGGIKCSAILGGGSTTRHLASWQATCTGSSIVNNIMLYDRVGSYDNNSITTTPTTFSAFTGLRYTSAGQEGLLVSATTQITTGLGATTANLTTLTFTNQAGNTAVADVAGATVPWAVSIGPATATFPAQTAFAAPFANTPWLPLAANVSGVRKLTTATSSAVNTGPICWVLSHPVGTLWVQTGLNMRQELARATFALERVYDDACLSLLVHTQSGSAESIYGSAKLVNG